MLYIYTTTNNSSFSYSLLLSFTLSLSHISLSSLPPSLSCEDEKKIGEVKEASERIDAVSLELIGCANRVAKEGEKTGPQELEDLQETLENTELLRRDWASQVYIVGYI